MNLSSTIEQLFLKEIEKVEKAALHPFVQQGIIPMDEENTLTGECWDEMDRELDSYFGAHKSRHLTNTQKITEDDDVEPLQRMEKVNTTTSNDYCREVSINIDDNTSLSEQMAQLIKLLQLSQAPGTRKVQAYSWRSWKGWLEEQKNNHPELENVDCFHPGKYVLGLYLLQMRVLYNYSHSTVVNCFWNQLCCLLKEERNIDLKQEMGDFIRKLFRALIRKYGNSKFKVCPLLNSDLHKWQRKLLQQDNREPSIKLRAIIMFGRYLGWRGDTISYMKLKDVEFKTVQADGQTYIVVKNTGFKDKGVGRIELCNTVYGSCDFHECPVYALLWYLFHVRKVFIQSTLLSVISNNKYDYKQGTENEYLFTQSLSEQPMSPKDMSNLMKNSSSTLLNCRYTMRSLRSGHICQALMTSILRYGIIKDHIRQAVKRHVGWNNDESIDAYERMSIFCSQNVSSLQDLSQNTEAQNVVRSYFDQDTTSKTPPTPFQSVRTTMRQRRRSVNSPKLPPPSVMKYVSFRNIKSRIVHHHPQLKIACDEETRTSRDGKDHQTIWMTYHQKYIKKWCENAEECQELLNSNPDYLHGKKEVKQSILLNVGKKVFLQLAVGEKRDEWIKKVFYEDYVPKKLEESSPAKIPPRSPSTRLSTKRRFLPVGAKRLLVYNSENEKSDDEETVSQPSMPRLITLPDFSNLVTQEDIESEPEALPSSNNEPRENLNTGMILDDSDLELSNFLSESELSEEQDTEMKSNNQEEEEQEKEGWVWVWVGWGWVWERRAIPPNPTRQYYTVFNSVNCADGVSRQC